MTYISAFMQGYENAIFAEDGVDPDSGRRYDEFVDFDSLVLKYMLEEFSMNSDCNGSSQYYVKPADSESTVAFAGPAWDYDTTFGDYAPSDRTWLLNPEWLLAGRQVGDAQLWWPELYKKADFFEGVCQAWRGTFSRGVRILLGQETDETGGLLSVDEYAAAIDSSAVMNAIRWPIPHLTTGSANAARPGSTIEENLTYLKNFISRRYDYLESIWSPQE